MSKGEENCIYDLLTPANETGPFFFISLLFLDMGIFYFYVVMNISVKEFCILFKFSIRKEIESF